MKQKNGQPLFHTSTSIKKRDIKKEDIIETRFRDMDKKLIGLLRGEVTLVSGLNSSGKSSWLSQLSLNVCDQNKKVALFSGELPDYRVLDWLHLQAAGKMNTIPTEWERYYRVRKDVAEDINLWIKHNLFIFNNEYGNNFRVVMDAMRMCKEKKGCDLIVLDNLMTMDLSSLNSQDKYERQKLFVSEISNFAKENNVHVIFVAHPRKSMGFLRKDDISGSADLSNLVDNVLIIHRVNHDFKRLTKETFKWTEDNPIYESSNVIEVCKNRAFGVQDVFIRLFFEIESKRMLNDKDEMLTYGWMTADQQVKMPFDL